MMYMCLWTARNLIQEKLRDVPEFYRVPYARWHEISFDIALALYEAAQLRDYPLSRWQHFKAAVGRKTCPQVR